MRRRGRGQSTVELALVLPLLMLLVLGIVDFGRVLVAANVVTYATREAARYGSLNSNITNGVTLIRTRVITESGRSSVTVDPTNIDICFLDSTGAQRGCSTNGGPMTPAVKALPGDIVSVSVHLPWSAQTALIQGVMPANFQVKSTAASVVEQ